MQKYGNIGKIFHKLANQKWTGKCGNVTTPENFPKLANNKTKGKIRKYDNTGSEMFTMATWKIGKRKQNKKKRNIIQKLRKMKLIIGENERKSFGKLATLEILEGGGGETMENRNEPQCDNWIVMSFRSDMETDINKERKRIPNWEPQNRVGPAQRNRKPAITPPPADYNRAEV